MKKISLIISACALALCMQSCQDLHRPDFNYTPSTGTLPTTSLKMFLNFDNNDFRDKGEWGFNVVDNGKIDYVEDGVKGTAYNGNSETYLLAYTPSKWKNGVENLGSCSVAFWMKSQKNSTVQGLFTIAHATKYWANYELFLENHSSQTEAFFKIHLWNQTNKADEEKWITVKIPDVFGDEWVHMAFVYNAATSTYSIYRNGVEAYKTTLANFGKLSFNNFPGVFSIGAIQISTKPALTTGGSSDPRYYAGQMDEFRFYDAALTEAEIKSLYTNKE